MTYPHEHDYFRTSYGALVCACGASYRPLPEQPETNKGESA